MEVPGDVDDREQQVAELVGGRSNRIGVVDRLVQLGGLLGDLREERQ